MRFPNELHPAFCRTEATIFAKTSAQCSTVIRHNFVPEPLAMVKNDTFFAKTVTALLRGRSMIYNRNNGFAFAKM